MVKGRQGDKGKRGRGEGYCRWEHLLVAYVDGELEGRAAGRLAAHLAGCVRCWDREARLRILSLRLAEMIDTSLSPEEEAALAKVQLPPEPPRRLPRRRANVVTTTVRGLAAWARGTPAVYEGT